MWVCFHLSSAPGCPSSFSLLTFGCWVWQPSTDSDGCSSGSIWWSIYRGSSLRPWKHLICSFLNLFFQHWFLFCVWLWAKCGNVATLKSAPRWDAGIPLSRLFLSFFPLPFSSLVDLPVLLRRLHSLALAKPVSWQSPWGFGNMEVSLPSKLWHHLWHRHVDQTASYRVSHTYTHIQYTYTHMHIHTLSRTHQLQRIWCSSWHLTCSARLLFTTNPRLDEFLITDENGEGGRITQRKGKSHYSHYWTPK